MPRGLHPAVITELKKDSVRLCHLVAMEFDSPEYMTDYAHDVEYDGVIYEASSSLLTIGAPRESNDIRVNSLNLELSGVNQTFIAKFLQENWINRRVIIFKAIMSSGQVVGQPIPIFMGQITQFEISEDNSTSKVIVSIASHWADFEKTSGRMTNDTNNRFYFPNDAGMEYAANSVRELKWGKK